MKKTSTLLLCLLTISVAHAETASIPVSPATRPVSTVIPKAGVPPTTPAAVKTAPAVTPAGKPVTATATTAIVTPAPVPAKSVMTPAHAVTAPAAPAATVTAPVTEAIATPAPAITLEQRHQQELLDSAQRIDKANHELQARNQDLQLQIENLALQNNVLKRDRSSEGIWKGALAVIAGFLMGWYFSGGGRRKSTW